MNPQLALVTTFLRRYPYPIVCVVVTIACAVASWFLWDSVQELQAARADKAKEGEAMLTLLVSGSTQRQELALAHEATSRIEANLVVEENLAENHWYFFKLEEQTKAHLPELHQLSSPADNTSSLYKRIPFTLRVTGTFDQVGAFLLALETGPRLVNVTNFNCARAAPDGAQLSLELSVEMLGKK